VGRRRPAQVIAPRQEMLASIEALQSRDDPQID
jgi:hypothetical protein